jgi:hypothetical protein
MSPQLHDERQHNRPNQMTTTTKSRQQIKLIISDIDGQNRKFLWSAYSDGSAMTREITQHLTHACSTTETFREEHPAGSEMAEMIHAMPCA